MGTNIRLSRRQLQGAGGTAAILASTLFTQGAAAAQSTEGATDLASVDGVADARVLPDGRVEVIMNDGRVVILEANQVAINGETIMILDGELDALMLTGETINILQYGIPAAAGIAGVALAASGGGDDAPTVPPPPVNQSPSFTSAPTASLAENGTAVTTVTATDSEGDAITYAIAGGADANLFSIDPSTGTLTFKAAPDFETPADANSDNRYDVTVSATDGTSTVTQDLVVTVTNENDNAPVLTSGATASVDENATQTDYTAAATDADGDAVTFAITGGADAALFTIDSATGMLALVAPADAENPNDANGDGVYDVEITASDGSNTTVQSVSVTLNDVDEAPVFTSGATGTFDENGSATSYTASATDPEAAGVTYSLATGGDNGLFAIDATTGVVTVSSAQNFELPGDSDTNGVYEIEVIATDAAGNATSQNVSLTLADVNEAPAITNEITFVDEGQTSGGVVTFFDPDGDSVAFAITGGADQNALSIDPTTGALTFNAVPDAEAPGDANGNNIYELQITVTDPDGLSDTRNFAVTVQDINDNTPVITSGATASFAENAIGVAYDIDATDADAGTTLVYSIGGTDAGAFNIDTATGEVSFKTPPDFENPTDGDGLNDYEITVTASDGTNATTQNVTITVIDFDNENPPLITSANAFSVDEDENNGPVVGTVTATDADPSNGGFGYAISGGADSGLFQIDPATGVLSFRNGVDADIPAAAGGGNVYDVEVSVTDQPSIGNARTTTQSIAVTVSNIDDEAPVFAAASATGTASENGTATSYTASATNTDGTAAVIYSKAGGADQNLFAIDTSTGALTFTGPQDFEAFGDANNDGVYEVVIGATDASGQTSTQTVSITLTDANDQAPVFASGATASLNENATATGYTAQATNPDTVGGPIQYSLGTSGDSGLFAIDQATGVLTFQNAPDFENAQDGNTDNDYVVEIIASDGANQTSQVVTVTVNDLNDTAPVITSAAATSVPENTGGAFFTVTATDEDTVGPAVQYSIVGGADQNDLTINQATGELSFVTAPDFENPTDASNPADNVYEITVQASDGTNTTTQNIAITVTDVSPEFISLANLGAEGFFLSGNNNDGGRLYGLSIGDFNGDGFADILGGLTAKTTTVNIEGVAQLINGAAGPQGVSVGNYSVLNVRGDDLIEGGVQDTLNERYFEIGDVTGDGIIDIFFEAGNEGYVYTGGLQNLPVGVPDIETFFNALPADQGFLLASPAPTTRIVAGNFDFDGDGINDLLATESNTSNRYIIYGSDSFTLTASGAGVFELDVANNTVTTFTGGIFGSGDFNGDGLDDFISRAGTVFTVYLGTSGRPASISTPDYSFTGFTGNTRIHTIGDVNGDGIDDIALVDLNAAPGEMRIYFGDAAGSNQTFSAPDAVIQTDGGDSFFTVGSGRSLAIGDFNGDGYDDFAIQLTNAANDKLAIVLGDANLGSSGPIGTSSLLYVETDIAGVDRPGAESLSGLGDVNGDGIDDFSFTIRGALPGGSNDSNAVVVYGQAAAQTAVNLTGGDTVGDDTLIGSSQDDFFSVRRGGDDLVLSGGGDDLVAFTTSANAVSFSGTSGPGQGSLVFDGGAGTDTIELGQFFYNLTDSQVSYTSGTPAGGGAPVGAVTADSSDFRFEGVERLAVQFEVVIDVETVTQKLGENINGVRTLVIEFTRNDPASVVINDAADWSASGQTTFEGTLYNVFTHTDGAQIYAEAGANNEVRDTSGNSLKGINQSFTPGGSQALATVGNTDVAVDDAFFDDGSDGGFDIGGTWLASFSDGFAEGGARSLALPAAALHGQEPLDELQALSDDALNEVRGLLAGPETMIRVGDAVLPTMGDLALQDDGGPLVEPSVPDFDTFEMMSLMVEDA